MSAIDDLHKRIVRIALKAGVEFPELSWVNVHGQYLDLCDKIEAKFDNAAAQRAFAEADCCASAGGES
jgi:hypothetical protein